MEKIFVADSYKDMEIIGEPFENEKGRLYVKVKGACPRCGGSGHYSYNSLDGTRCYGCNGSGISVQQVRAYTEKEYNRMTSANARARQKKEDERAAKARDLVENAAAYKHEVALKLGFNENEEAYIVCGNTFEIKDELKSMGARFDTVMKWFFPSEVELPEGYQLCKISFDDIYDYSVSRKWAELKENAKNIVSEKMIEAAGESTSEYYPGKEKDRIRNIPAKVENIHGFNGMYGYTFVYTFSSDNYVFVWMTAKSFENIAIGDAVKLTGTIKKFDEYMGVKNTHLTRCIVEAM